MDLGELATKISNVKKMLSEVLGFDISSSQKADLGFLALYFDELERAIKTEEIDKIDRAYQELEQICTDLMFAKMFLENDDKSFDLIRNGILSDESTTFFGVRAELSMLSFLLQDYYDDPNLELDNIVKQESPDYIIHTGPVQIEVTSGHLRKPGKQAANKITKAIRKKSNKPYSNRETVVVMDITNLAYRQAEAELPFEKLIEHARKTLNTSKLGGVILMYSGFNIDGKYMSYYTTLVHKDASEVLKGFLQKYYSNNPDEKDAYISPVLKA